MLRIALITAEMWPLIDLAGKSNKIFVTVTTVMNSLRSHIQSNGSTPLAELATGTAERRRSIKIRKKGVLASCIRKQRCHRMPMARIQQPFASHLRPRVSRPIPLMAGRREFGPDDEKNFSHVTLCLRFIYRDFSSSGRPVARISRPRGGRSVSVPGGPDQAPHHLNSLEVACTLETYDQVSVSCKVIAVRLRAPCSQRS